MEVHAQGKRSCMVVDPEGRIAIAHFVADLLSFLHFVQTISLNSNRQQAFLPIREYTDPCCYIFSLIDVFVWLLTQGVGSDTD
jgi:hypothetical protein